MCSPSLRSPRLFFGRTRRSALTFITVLNHPPFCGRGEPMCSPSSRPPRFMPFTILNDSPFFCRGRPMSLPSSPSPSLCPPRWFSGRTRRSAPTFITVLNHPPFGVGANLRVCPLCVPPDPYHSRFQMIHRSSVGADLCLCPLRLRPLCAHPGGFQGGHAGPPLHLLRFSSDPPFSRRGEPMCSPSLLGKVNHPECGRRPQR